MLALWLALRRGSTRRCKDADVSTVQDRTLALAPLLRYLSVQAVMPPRRSARVAAVAAQRTCAFPALPLAVELRIFSLVPADQRLRCAEVARGWRATVAQPALWSRVDLSPASGVELPVSAGLLHAAVARAAGALAVLDVSGADIGVEDLCAALRAASGVVELHTAFVDEDEEETHDMEYVDVIMAAAPLLRELHASFKCALTEVPDLMELRPPFAVLRPHTLTLISYGTGIPTPLPLASAAAFADARLQPDLVSFSLHGADLRAPGVADALAVGISARPRLRRLRFTECEFSPAAKIALARALSHGRLTWLSFTNALSPFLDAAFAPALGAALRANSTLQSLTLWYIRQVPACAMAALMGGLVGHRSLCSLRIVGAVFDDSAAAGAELAALIAADAPMLTVLSAWSCNLGEAGLGALCDALPSNHHIRDLDARDNNTPPGFIRSRLLPAVRANTSLRTVHMVESDEDLAEDDMRVVLDIYGILSARRHA